jgi:glycosyltransferase (activator-dependent family)
MRVLLVLPAEKSIFNYLVPVTWALRTAGHEVHVASLPRFASTITQAGLTAVPVGHDRDPWRITENRPEERAALRAGVAAPYDLFDAPGSASWDYLRDGMTAAVNGWHRLTNFPMIADLVEYTRFWEPDLVLWEPLCYAGAIAAKACGAAHGRLLFGIDVFGATRVDYLRAHARQAPADRVDPLADWLGGYARKYGFDAGEDLAVGDFTIDQLPASLSLDAGLDTARVQFVPYGGAAVVPDWLKRPAERPRVALTLGLTATEVFGGYNVPLSEILLGLSSLDVEVVATVAQDVQELLPPMPPNVRMVPYVPWHALAPTCAAVVHHAGAATLATTARHPVPQLALHFHFDQPYLGRKLAEHGAGLEIHTGDATGGNVRDAVARLLTEQSFKDRAAALRDEIFALPTPNDLAGTLEELTAKHRTR